MSYQLEYQGLGCALAVLECVNIVSNDALWQRPVVRRAHVRDIVAHFLPNQLIWHPYHLLGGPQANHFIHQSGPWATVPFGIHWHQLGQNAIIYANIRPKT